MQGREHRGQGDTRAARQGDQTPVRPRRKAPGLRIREQAAVDVGDDQGHVIAAAKGTRAVDDPGMRRGGGRIALGNGGTAAKEHHIGAREVEALDVADPRHFVPAGGRPAEVARVVEQMQLGMGKFAFAQQLDQRLADQAGGADDCEPRTGRGRHGAAVMLGVVECTSAHCARCRKQ